MFVDIFPTLKIFADEQKHMEEVIKTVVEGEDPMVGPNEPSMNQTKTLSPTTSSKM